MVGGIFIEWISENNGEINIKSPNTHTTIKKKIFKKRRSGMISLADYTTRVNDPSINAGYHMQVWVEPLLSQPTNSIRWSSPDSPDITKSLGPAKICRSFL